MPAEHNSSDPECETQLHSASPRSSSRPRDFGVAASPFNGIKVELGFAIVLGASLWLAADSITANETTQWLLLLGYGLSSMVWLVLRTRAVLHRCMINGEMSHETHK